MAIRKIIRRVLINYLGKLQTQHSNVVTGEMVKIYSPSVLSDVQIGTGTYVSQNSKISNTVLGKFCSIGPNFLCGWGIHPTDGVSTHPYFYSNQKQNGFTLVETSHYQERKTISIGNDVFIGANVTVLDGVIIGDGAVIAAGSVVYKDVKPYSIVGGSPLKIIKTRFDEETISLMSKLQWWDHKNLHDLIALSKNDLNEFLKKINN